MVVTSLLGLEIAPGGGAFEKTVPFTGGLQEGQDCSHVSLQGTHPVFHTNCRYFRCDPGEGIHMSCSVNHHTDDLLER